MESEYNESDFSVENHFRQEFELLKDMFEAHFSPDVIAGVLEDCDGDVNLAVDTLTKIQDSAGQVTENHQLTDNPTEIEISPSIDTECQSSNMSTNNNTCLPLQSYAAASQTPVNATGYTPIPASKKPPHTKNVMPKVDYWTDQIRKIITIYNKGSRLLVIMRGPPGCGKSYLARVIVESTVGAKNTSKYIFSADDHMQVNGRYHYDVQRLGEVHMKNQKCVYKAVLEGRSPVIVDNTNMATFEMYPYVNDAVTNGYIVEVVEPNTPWSNVPSQLAKRNSHGVPINKIEKMLQRYEGVYTGESLIKYFNLEYPRGKKPPVRRNIPPFIQTPPSLNHLVNLEHVAYLDQGPLISDSASARSSLISTENQSTNDSDNPTSTVNSELSVGEISRKEKQQEAAKNLDELIKVEVEWDNEVKWEAISSNREPVNATAISSDPKPQRSKANPTEDTFIDKSVLHGDCSKYFMYVPPWQSDTVSTVKEMKEIPVTTKTSCTHIEKDDFYNENFVTKIGVPRNINQIPNLDIKEPRIPKQRMLDQSTITRATFSTSRCEHEEKHFQSMKKRFRNISRPVLREIFDNCAGDVHWACSIVSDGIEKNNLQTLNIEENDSDEDDEVDCDCSARYNIIPDITTESVLPILVENLPSDSSSTPTAITLSKKKTKKDNALTEDTVILKRQIENSIMIADNHYSQHYLNKRRPARHGNSPNSNSEEPSTSYSNDNAMATNEANASINLEFSNQNELTIDERTTITQVAFLNLKTPDQKIYFNEGTVNTINSKQDANLTTEISYQKTSTPSPGTSSMFPEFPRNAHHQDIPSTYSANNDAIPCISTKPEKTIADFDDDDYESDDNRSVTCESKSVTVNLGMELINKLDETYGRLNFDYPEGIKPILSIPTDIMLRLNALWIESISDQLDNNVHQQMIRQDEDFARKLQRELELEATKVPEATEKKKPECASFSEIMDVDLALAIYEKQVKHIWKSKEPQDLAAQMTRKKLFELFPDMNKDVLSELLIAHDNKFEATVECPLHYKRKPKITTLNRNALQKDFKKFSQNTETVLLISTGQSHYLNLPNPINKFIMEKTNENRLKLLKTEGKVFNEQNDSKPDSGSEEAIMSMHTINEWRQMAEKFRLTRDLYRNKAMACYEGGDFLAARRYNEIAAGHTSNYDCSNNYAVAALMHNRVNAHPDVNVIDLHYFRVSEAETSLDLFIDNRLRKLRESPTQKSLMLHIITGRGKHSPGKPRIRPAIMKRLTDRGLAFRQQNPGLLEVRLKPTHLLTNELNNHLSQ